MAPYEFLQPVSPGSAQIQGNTKVLLCQVSGRPPPVYRWKKDGVYVTADNGTNPAFKIEKIKQSDAGLYQCVASNQYGAILSNSAHLRVACKYDSDIKYRNKLARICDPLSGCA